MNGGPFFNNLKTFRTKILILKKRTNYPDIYPLFFENLSNTVSGRCNCKDFSIWVGIDKKSWGEWEKIIGTMGKILGRGSGTNIAI